MGVAVPATATSQRSVVTCRCRSPAAVTVKYTEGGGTTPPPPPPATFTHVNTTGSVAQGAMKVFPLAMPAGKKVVIRTTSTADVDLYIQFGAEPTTESYLARGYTTSGNETVTYTATSTARSTSVCTATRRARSRSAAQTCSQTRPASQPGEGVTREGGAPFSFLTYVFAREAHEKHSGMAGSASRRRAPMS